VLLCIGTDRSTGDSFAPMIGTLLSEKNINNNNFTILGTLQNPVHAKNLRSTLSGLKSDNSLIIAVDASLGDAKNIGKIKIVDGSIRPGAGVGKELPIVGDISITAVVNFDYINPYITLQSTRLGIVYDMSKIVSEAILEVLDRLEFSYSLVNAN
jgi:putative sporulation protein YyaC